MTEHPTEGTLLRPEQRLVFVGGLHRSGTSLLARLISTHPDGSGLTGTNVPEDEGQHVQDVYPVGTEHGGPGRFAHTPEAHLTESSPLATPANARRLVESWAPYWDMSKTYLVEKTPPNLLMGRFLQQLYPDASFVFIVRHPVPVSLASRKWRKKLAFGRLMNHWFTAHDIARTDLPHLRRVHVLKYEDLMAQPDQTLDAVDAVHRALVGAGRQRDQPVTDRHLRRPVAGAAGLGGRDGGADGETLREPGPRVRL